jgi:hypothetical protein
VGAVGLVGETYSVSGRVGIVAADAVVIIDALKTTPMSITSAIKSDRTAILTFAFFIMFFYLSLYAVFQNDFAQRSR